MQTHTGGCHCGRLRFEVSGKIDRVLDCNCSICAKKGFLHWIVAPERFRLLSAPGDAALYRFNTRTAKHYFCPVCGISAYYVPRSHPDMIDVNVRCLDGVDPSDLQIEPFDGRNWERSRAALADASNPTSGQSARWVRSSVTKR